MALKIRAATKEDIHSMVKLRLATLTNDEVRGFSAPEFAFTSSTAKLRGVWGQENKLKDGFEVFIGEAKSRLVGYIMFKTEGNFGYIDDIVVDKQEQGKGIGKALVGYVEDLAKSKGCSIMKTDTTEDANGVAWRSYGFWIRMGYSDIGERLSTGFSFKEIPFIKRLK